MILNRIILSCCLVFLSVALAAGQAAPAPKKINSGGLGGGFAVTGGNTDTQNFNLTFNFVHDPMTKNIIKANAAYLRGKQNSVLNLDKTSATIRDEWTLSGRTFVFAQNDYLRDQFKQIIFLWVPVGGLGYKIINTDPTQLTVDGGVGAFLEKNPGRPVSKSGALSASERLQRKFASNATLIQSLGTNWKTSDFADSLTNFSVGLTTSVAKNLELKVDFIDSYKNKPATAGVKKNDTAFVTAFVVKF